MRLEAWMANLVMPVANMLLAAVRAGGYRRDEQPEQDHPPASRPFGDCVCPAIEPGAGPGEPGIHRAAIWFDRESQSAWMGPGTDPGHRRGPGGFGPQCGGEAGLPGPGASGMPWRSRCRLWTGGFTTCPQFRRPTTVARILQPHGDARRGCRWGVPISRASTIGCSWV